MRESTSRGVRLSIQLDIQHINIAILETLKKDRGMFALEKIYDYQDMIDESIETAYLLKQSEPS